MSHAEIIAAIQSWGCTTKSSGHRIGPDAVNAALKKYPDLSIDGWRINTSDPKSPYSYSNFPARRAMLLSPENICQIATACAYLQAHGIDKGRGSYGLKHQIERWAYETGAGGYVSNGCAIVAAVLSGYEIVRQRNSLNCRFKKC